jgi:hypothetical protein
MRAKSPMSTGGLSTARLSRMRDVMATYYSEVEICEIVWLVASEHLYNMTNIGLNIYSDMLCDISRKEKWKPNIRRHDMRFMVIVKASKHSEAGVLPSAELLAEMGKFNEELTKAGVLLAAEGLQASSKGARMRFSGTKRTVIDGPFAETKELVAGFWIWKCKSLQEAIEWVKRCPNPMPDEEAEIEIRQVFEPQDFGVEFTPELREQEERLRAQSERLVKAQKR